MNDDAKGYVIGALIGVGVGLLIGYLTAPRSGSETREIIRDKVVQVKNKAQEMMTRRGAGNGAETA